MIHLWHKWEVWQEPVVEDCKHVSRRVCRICRKPEYCVVREVHDFEVKDRKEWRWGNGRHTELHTAVIKLCKRCGRTSVETDVETLMDAS